MLHMDYSDEPEPTAGAGTDQPDSLKREKKPVSKFVIFIIKRNSWECPTFTTTRAACQQSSIYFPYPGTTLCFHTLSVESICSP